jgi:hypothetical protein
MKALVLLAGFAAAALGLGQAAPTRSYVVVDTGQHRRFDDRGWIIEAGSTEFPGQDGDYDGPQPAYQDDGDGTVTDLQTGLIWQREPPEELYTWQAAMAYADALDLAGHDDWRLPNIKELLSIMDFAGSIRIHAPYVDTRYFGYHFPDVSGGHRDIDAQYWSSTPYFGRVMTGLEGAFGVNFADGRIKCYPTKFGPRGGPSGPYVRCVRGPEYGKNDFADNGDGTVTDRATGLMWTKADSGVPMNWHDALHYAEALEFAGFSDWRLPNAKELQSIVDYTRAPDAVDPARRPAAIDPLFDLTDQESWFWTSTSHGDNTSHAIYIAFGRATSAWIWAGEKMNAHGAGAMRSDPKSGDPTWYAGGLGPQGDEIRIQNYVRCVRGG